MGTRDTCDAERCADIRKADCAGEIPVDLPCFFCGYNLRTMDAAAQCPECGERIVGTLARPNPATISAREMRKTCFALLLTGVAIIYGVTLLAARIAADELFHYAPPRLAIYGIRTAFVPWLALFWCGFLLLLRRSTGEALAIFACRSALAAGSIAGLSLIWVSETIIQSDLGGYLFFAGGAVLSLQTMLRLRAISANLPIPQRNRSVYCFIASFAAADLGLCFLLATEPDYGSTVGPILMLGCGVLLLVISVSLIRWSRRLAPLPRIILNTQRELADIFTSEPVHHTEERTAP